MTLLPLTFDPADHIARIDPLIRGNFLRPVDRSENGHIGNGQGIGKAVLKDIGDRGVACLLYTSDAADE